ncbi:MAG TPA: phenylalanine--tRNA ligase subunit alpha [Thermoanaerobaculia bacterium]|jgi:phenylalanyl-tRNA synthetase alpha chain
MSETLVEKIQRTGREFDSALENAGTDLRKLEEVRLEYLSRKGRLPALFDDFKTTTESKATLGKLLNTTKQYFEREFREHLEAAEAAGARIKPRDTIDVTLPARTPSLGHLHPITLVRMEMEQIFREMGYSIDPGPEIESDWFNFEALNFTPDHPARDTQDTFFTDANNLLLRTHTSNVQIRAMSQYPPPLKVLSAGRVFRRDEITMRRSPMFHQVEAFLVDRGIHIGHMRATIEHFIRRLFGQNANIRLRPSFFPFTEPSAEVDMSCVFCKGQGCGTCSQTGWMEILGCGMIHPQVLRNVGIDPEEWSGFAFGMGLDRVAMLKYDIPNIRTLFENDLRVLQQF